jgi:hypothetical protein
MMSEVYTYGSVLADAFLIEKFICVVPQHQQEIHTKQL